MPDEIHPLVKLLCEDRRYKLEAYQFVRAGLTYAQDDLGLGNESSAVEERHEGRPLKHVTGQDLCHALRQFAHEQFGLLARHVLASWGIQATSDFGEIVYNLIKIGEMTKSEEDRREDFDKVFDFEQALVKDFVIASKSE
jgi:uncharacterized repeat protein (TIGR04138 family)